MLKSVVLEFGALSLVDSDLLLELQARLSEDKYGLRLVLRLLLQSHLHEFFNELNTRYMTIQTLVSPIKMEYG